jgi:hypothetical protein
MPTATGLWNRRGAGARRVALHAERPLVLITMPGDHASASASAASHHQSAAAKAWLRQWQTDHSGTQKYRPASNNIGLPASRIPRLVVVTVGSVQKALAGKWAENFASFWTLSPEYAHLILEDADCESFLDACCAPDEGLAFRLVRTGTQKNNVFLASWLREIGGIVVDQDTRLLQPLSTVVHPWASIVTTWVPCDRSRIGCWSYGNLFAFEPGSPLWRSASRRVVSNVLVQADMACRRSADGCRGFYGCVQELTAQGPYTRAQAHFLARYDCAPPTYACNNSLGYCVRSGTTLCKGATHGSLRRLVVPEADASPTRHVECHALPGAKKKCERPNETTVHYVSKPEGAVKYYRTPEGARDGSSAPGYYWPRCSNSTRLGVGPNWSKCARSRSQVAQWKVLKSDCHKKESMTADPYMDTFVRDFA